MTDPLSAEQRKQYLTLSPLDPRYASPEAQIARLQRMIDYARQHAPDPLTEAWLQGRMSAVRDAQVAAEEQGPQEAEPPWASTPAPGQCGRGHLERRPKCPACHDLRIAAYERAQNAQVAASGSQGEPVPKTCECGATLTQCASCAVAD